VRAQPIPIPGLPISGLPSAGLPSSLHSSTSYSSVSSVSSISSFGGRALSPRTVNTSPSTAGNGSGTRLPPPKSVAQRQTSISPTPRKRYTVALGSPIVAPDELSSNAAEPPRRVGTPRSFAKPQSSIDSTFFSSTSSSRGDMDRDDHAEYADLGAEETIGKSAAARLITGGMGDYKAATPSPPMSNRRLRAQSAYGLSNVLGSDTMASSTVNSSGMPSVAPLRPKLRSKSSERLNLVGGGTGDGMVSALGGGAKFVDPLVLRKQSRDSFKAIAMPKPIGKVPIGQLVAFFDGDKNNNKF